MVALIQPPQPRHLLPPLLACLPTAFASPRPPPALLPILSPILRQRVQIFSASTTTNNPKDSWLRFLCWDAGQAEQLQQVVDGTSFEPHPVSGEVDLPGDLLVVYKRVDEETLRACVSLPEYSLRVIYLWCPDDGDGGWKVAEVLPRCDDDGQKDDSWSHSIGEANTRAREALLEYALKQAEGQEVINDDDDDDDDDDAAYWAQYDETPTRTPTAAAAERSRAAPISETAYFDRYNDVQPALDPSAAEDATAAAGESSLNGDLLTSLLLQQHQKEKSNNNNNNNNNNNDPPRRNGYPSNTKTSEEIAMMLNHPRPSSASSSSSSSNAVARLEQEAENHSACEAGVRQHISSNIQSLFRLARSAGISQSEFRSLVKTEMDSLDQSEKVVEGDGE